MLKLASRDRACLAGLRICNVREPRIEKPLDQVPCTGRRVLIPVRLQNYFETICRYDGKILEIRYRRIVVQCARRKIGAYYCTHALPEQAPKGFSCSTLTTWIYAFVGVSLPRYAIDQSRLGRTVSVPVHGGFAFFKGLFPIQDHDRRIGHVGITTRKETLIHGSMNAGAVVEEPIPLDATLFTDPFANGPHVLVIIPTKIQGVDTALDLARFLQRPPRTL